MRLADQTIKSWRWWWCNAPGTLAALPAADHF
jgi:hypothetical protein